MNTPALDKFVKLPHTNIWAEMTLSEQVKLTLDSQSELTELKQSNADLLAALEEAVKYMSLQNAPIVDPEIRRQDILPKAISAIAAARGKK